MLVLIYNAAYNSFTHCSESKTLFSMLSSENILSVLQAADPVLSSIDFSAVDTPSLNSGSVEEEIKCVLDDIYDN